jgi:HK97 gp10 family phage protein
MRVNVDFPNASIGWDDMNAAAQKAVEQTMLGAMQIIANDAKRSVARGPKSGHVYTTRFVTMPNGGVVPVGTRPPHQASAPGEAPATDTGRLVASIIASATGMTGTVEARSLYAVHLEYGTRAMAARPFMLPAAERNRDRIQRLLQSAISTAIGQFQVKAGS